MAIVTAVGWRVVGEVVTVDLNKRVLRSEDVLEAVGNEEEAISG